MYCIYMCMISNVRTFPTATFSVFTRMREGHEEGFRENKPIYRSAHCISPTKRGKLDVLFLYMYVALFTPPLHFSISKIHTIKKGWSGFHQPILTGW